MRANNPKEDFELIQRAFVVAERCHRGQKRKSGDPYITHPLAVATILADLGLSGDDAGRRAAARHRRGHRPTPWTTSRPTSAPRSPCWSTASPSSTRSASVEAAQAETVRKMLVAMAKDIRVLIIKLADRLHNMRTLALRCREAKQARKAARDAGDLRAAGPPARHEHDQVGARGPRPSRRCTPRRYEEIEQHGGGPQPRSASSTSRRCIADQVARATCRAAKIKADGHRPAEAPLLDLPEDGRPGQGVRRDLRPRRRPGPRRLGEGLLRRPRRRSTRAGSRCPGRFKDYIAMPKFNMYQSLHTTVIGPERQAARDADPHPGDAPPRRVRRRRALAVQGPAEPTRPARQPARRRHGLAASLVDWQQETVGPRRVHATP